jgi:hypothetical protein
VASAPSGTGKTAAYLLPILQCHLSRLEEQQQQQQQLEPREGFPTPKNTAGKGVASLMKLSDGELETMGFLGKAVRTAREEQQSKAKAQEAGKQSRVKPSVLVLVPTGELGEQVEGVVGKLAQGITGFHVMRLGRIEGFQDEVVLNIRNVNIIIIIILNVNISSFFFFVGKVEKDAVFGRDKGHDDHCNSKEALEPSRGPSLPFGFL